MNKFGLDILEKNISCPQGRIWKKNNNNKYRGLTVVHYSVLTNVEIIYIHTYIHTHIHTHTHTHTHTHMTALLSKAWSDWRYNI